MLVKAIFIVFYCNQRVDSMGIVDTTTYSGVDRENEKGSITGI